MPTRRQDRQDAAAEATPDDATSMSVPPPSGEARQASEAVGSPQAGGRGQREPGPSPHNKTGRAPAPPTAPAWKSARPAGRSRPAPRAVPEDSPAKETLKTLREGKRDRPRDRPSH